MESGYDLYQCECGYEEVANIVEATAEHSYKEVERREATEVDEGFIKYQCENCIDTYIETNTYCSHQFGKWTITARPTFNSNGTKRRICSLCGYEEKKSIPQLQDTQKQEVSITIPKKPGKVTGLTVKNRKKRKVIVSWNWKTNTSGFQIQYAQNKKFTKKKKSKMVGRWTSQKVITKLKKNKTYYIRVRAYRQSSGKKIYGKWSKIKKIKIKK